MHPKTYVMKKIFCNIFGHHYAVSKKVTGHIKEYKCVHFSREVTTDVNGNLSTLTPELQEINATLEKLYQRRHRATEEVAPKITPQEATHIAQQVA
jgi:hypothetical protein